MKKTLAFLDTPDYEYGDFKRLVNLQFEKIDSIKGRSLSKLFASLNLLMALIFHYSLLGNNLVAAKECSKYMVLRAWRWVLNNRLENKAAVKREIDKILLLQFRIFSAFFKRTAAIATLQDGLYAENSLFFEKIGYPLRCFNYLDDMIYYARLREYIPKGRNNAKRQRNIKTKMKEYMMEIIDNNSGFFRPLLDSHSIPIVQLFVYIGGAGRRREDVDFITRYVFEVIHAIAIMKLKNGLLPEFHNSTEFLIEALATGKKPVEYTDDSSMLIAALLELLVIFKNEEMYQEVRKHFSEEMSFQIPSIDIANHNVEELLFERNLNKEYYVEILDDLPVEFSEFIKQRNNVEIREIKYRTDEAGYSFLRYLAHSYFKNELLPEEWRIFMKE